MLYVAIDMGGTKTMVSVAAGSADAVIDTMRFDTLPSRGLPAVADDCARLINRILARSGHNAGEIVSMGISAPGMVNADGIMILSPVTGWVDADLAGAVNSALGIKVPTAVDNDVNACALAEMKATGKRNMLWITVSTGIGGAIVIDGRVYAGADSLSGEIGHTKVEYASPRRCACGQCGCVEAYASGTAVGRIACELAESDAGYRALYEERRLEINAKSCSVLAREGEARSVGIFDAAGDYLGRAIANAANLLNPEIVYIGGGMADSLDLLLPAIRGRMKLGAIPALTDLEIAKSTIGYEASLKGAFALAGIAENSLK